MQYVTKNIFNAVNISIYDPPQISHSVCLQKKSQNVVDSNGEKFNIIGHLTVDEENK